MNHQEVFTKVKDHLLKQGKRADTVFGCAYRADEGLSCAVGCLIPDDKYDPLMEGRGVGALRNNPKDKDVRARKLEEVLTSVLGPLEERDIDLLAELQRLHDTIAPEAWAEELQRIALWFNLEY